MENKENLAELFKNHLIAHTMEGDCNCEFHRIHLKGLSSDLADMADEFYKSLEPDTPGPYLPENIDIITMRHLLRILWKERSERAEITRAMAGNKKDDSPPEPGPRIWQKSDPPSSTEKAK